MKRGGWVLNKPKIQRSTFDSYKRGVHSSHDRRSVSLAQAVESWEQALTGVAQADTRSRSEIIQTQSN